MIKLASTILAFRMSQKKISTFFQPRGQKRKHEDDNETSEKQSNVCADEKVLSPKGNLENLNTTNSPTPDTSMFRAHIKALSEKNPALAPNIGLTWFKALSKEFEKDYFKELGQFLKTERSKYTVYPPEKDVYSWTTASKIHDIKVVILGQDPYHGPNQAHGLAFSVRKGVAVPPSLQNMYKELANDIPDFVAPSHGYLYGWATQGVLLLNAVLTVRASCPNSHKDAKWTNLTDAVIKWIDQNLPNTVFMLWGKNAQEKMSLISKGKHLVLTAPHPSPFSAARGFFGCSHFSKANEYLKKHNKKPIDWNYLP